MIDRFATASLYALALGALLGGCAKSSGGTDSTTHWLMACESDAQCGELQCLCGACSASCESNAACSSFGAASACLAPGASSCAQAERTCALECSGSADCSALGADALCTAGRCERRALAPQDAGSQLSCHRMDARSDGDCDLLVGLAWNGTSCEAIGCACAGADCDKLMTDVECNAMIERCEPLAMCTRPSDCVLADKQCCRCGPPSGSDLVAISSSRAQDHADRICDPMQLCPDCESGSPDDRYVAECAPATRWEGGECRVLDLARLACTEEVGCRVRARSCCECNASTAIDALLAVPVEGDIADSALCDPDVGCAECEARYPENVEARCSVSGLCELYEDGVLIEL